MSTHNEINGPVHGQVVQAQNVYLHSPRQRASSIAFYYPYIHIRDDTFLKYAALYWPVITRLVPPGYQPTDSPAAAAFGRAGVLCNLAADAALPVPRRFFDMVASRANELRDRFGIEHRDRWPVRTGISAAAGPGIDPRLTYLHYGKLSVPMVSTIVANGLGVRHSGTGGEWVGMHPDLASIYMVQLVSALARRESLHPVTDHEVPHNALLMHGADNIADVLLDVPPRPTHRNPTQQFVRIAVETVVPAGLADVPAEKILELRETFPTDFHRFRAHVGNRFTELRAEATADLHIGVAVDELVRAELAELEDKLRSIRLVPRRVRVWLKADAVRESPVGWLFRAGQALR